MIKSILFPSSMNGAETVVSQTDNNGEPNYIKNLK